MELSLQCSWANNSLSKIWVWFFKKVKVWVKSSVNDYIKFMKVSFQQQNWKNCSPKSCSRGICWGFSFKPSNTHLLVLHLHWNTACCVSAAASVYLLLNFCRWVSPARRPIRTSWTSRALNALSSCQRGKHSGEYCIRFCAPIVSCKLTSAACVHSSATERDEWLEAIAKAIDDYTKKKITFISSRSQEEVRTWRLCGWTVW